MAEIVRTQLLHAVGAAYSLKMDKKQACAVTYFGDGGTSEVLYYNSSSVFYEVLHLS